MASAERLKRNRDFSRVYRLGFYKSGNWIGLHAYRRRGISSGYPSRVGFTVNRVIRGAVRRNRAKRLLRESFRLSQVETGAGYDLILSTRWGPSGEPLFGALLEETERLLVKAGVGRPRMNGGERQEQDTV